MQFTLRETVVHGVKRVGEIEVEHVNILRIVHDYCHPLLRCKKAWGRPPDVIGQLLPMLLNRVPQESLENLAYCRSKTQRLLVGGTLIPMTTSICKVVLIGSSAVPRAMIS